MSSIDNKQSLLASDDRQSPQLWRSTGELNNTEAFQQQLHREFPEGASELPEHSPARRNFVKIMGASLAFAGVSSCGLIRKPKQKIRPYAKSPEELIPGKPIYYATAMNVGEQVTGLLAESHEGRPTKIEGNPKHSTSLGATTIYNQASVLSLYDPDRLQYPHNNGKKSTMADFSDAFASMKSAWAKQGGKGVAFLSEQLVSPTSYRLVDEIASEYPNMQFFRYEPVNHEQMYEGLKLATGEDLTLDYDFSEADIVVSFDHDFLSPQALSLTWSRDFADRRDPDNPSGMNRVYQLESGFSITGAKADHRVGIHRSDVENAVWLVLKKLFAYPALARRIPSALRPVIEQVKLDSAHIVKPEVIDALVDDLVRHNGTSLVTAGPHHSPVVHGLVYIINAILRNESKTVLYRPRPFAQHRLQQRSSVTAISELTKQINAGTITELVILGGDPVYTAPADLDFKQACKKLSNIVHVSSSPNATTQVANWVLPRSHYLESWSDAMAFDQSISVVQPLIQPLYKSVSDNAFLQKFLKNPASDFNAVKQTVSQLSSRRGSAKSWRHALHDGIVQGPSKPLDVTQTYALELSRVAHKTSAAEGKKEKGSFEVSFSPSHALYDGRFVNVSWLQELPDPITKLTWDNAALVSPQDARELKLSSGDVIEISSGSQKINVPLWVSHGQVKGSITLALGYGQTNVGRVGSETGFNAYALRTTASFAMVQSASVRSLGRTYPLATTQEHWSMEDRALVRQADLTTYKKHPTFAPDAVHVPKSKSLYPERSYDEGYQWAMNFDLNRCTGCNACVIGCQSENNIPVVGKEEVANGREMHWIRIDRYFAGNEDEPSDMLQQPVTCLHCENAPCESVCPVAATVHSEEGLNDMVYNRCIGTRYCSNNCPVKVRRFNFLAYHQLDPQSVPNKDFSHIFDLWRVPPKTKQMQFNPDVTVRMRGVMEKCTYCVQRINEAKFTAKNEGRELRDGEILTACQQACPADAISFGNMLDSRSEIARRRKLPRNYEILNGLYLKSRTTYLAGVRNTHPSLSRALPVTDPHHKQHHQQHPVKGEAHHG